MMRTVTEREFRSAWGPVAGRRIETTHPKRHDGTTLYRHATSRCYRGETFIGIIERNSVPPDCWTAYHLEDKL